MWFFIITANVIFYFKMAVYFDPIWQMESAVNYFYRKGI